MLSSATWNALVGATNHLKQYIGTTFFYEKWGCDVTIYSYTLCTQLLFKSKDGRYSQIWLDDYLSLVGDNSTKETKK